MSVRNFTSVTKVYYETNNHTGYEIVENSVTSFVPKDDGNKDYQDILAWEQVDGNTIGEPA